MPTIIGASRIATLLGDFDRSPAYAGLAEALRLLIADGRIPYDARLPSERDLTGALAVSRTTVTRAYAALVDAGYAASRRGAGTFATLPGGRARTHDRALLPRAGDEDAIDLNCAAPQSPPGLAQAYAAAVDDLPAYFSGHGYYPAGLPPLQQAIAATYDARGLPTDPGQIMVTAGALSAVSIVAQAFTAPGQRVQVESPVYPNATQALRHGGARLVPAAVDPDGWDLDAVAAGLRQNAPTLAYLIPDFQNPTGHLMTDAQRQEYAGHLRRSRTIAVVDEAHQALALDDLSMPRPFASFAPDPLTLGSASKSFWGGLRLGWIRAPRGSMDRLTQALQGDQAAVSVQSLTAVLPRADLDAYTQLYADGLEGVDPELAPAVAGLANWDRGADLARITVVTRDAPESEAAEGLVDRVRDQYIPAAGLAGQARVGGATANNLDLAREISGQLPVVVLAVLALSFVLLAMAFRSLVLPLQAIAMNLLSVGAAYGLIVAVFQWGWGEQLLGFTSEGHIEVFVPLFLFSILFGLSRNTS